MLISIRAVNRHGPRSRIIEVIDEVNNLRAGANGQFAGLLAIVPPSGGTKVSVSPAAKLFPVMVSV